MEGFSFFYIFFYLLLCTVLLLNHMGETLSKSYMVLCFKVKEIFAVFILSNVRIFIAFSNLEFPFFPLFSDLL